MGGLGYIGSHTCVELLNSGYEVVIVDNLLNSKVSVVDRVETHLLDEMCSDLQRWQLYCNKSMQ